MSLRGGKLKSVLESIDLQDGGQEPGAEFDQTEALKVICVIIQALSVVDPVSRVKVQEGWLSERVCCGWDSEHNFHYRGVCSFRMRLLMRAIRILEKARSEDEIVTLGLLVYVCLSR